MNVGRYLRGEDRHVGTARTTQPQPPQRTEQCNYPDCKCPTENPCLKGLAQPEQEPVAWHTNSPSDPEICNERSAQACGPVYCGDSGGYCNKCPKQKTIQAVKPCKGMNCGCTDGRSHSLECLAELAAAIAGGVFVQEALKEKNT